MNAVIWVIIGLLAVVVLYATVIRRKTGFLRGPEHYQPVTLIDSKQISHDTKIFVFGLNNNGVALGLPIGQHLLFRTTVNDEEVIRKYTPTSRFELKGRFEVPIKIYSAGVHPRFPEGGKMTQHLDSLRIGEEIDISGPRGNLTYIGDGQFCRETKPLKSYYKVSKLGLVAGGTGITPCFQLIQYIIESNHSVELYLIFANKSVEDILLRERLEEYSSMGKLNLLCTLDAPPEGWTSGRGFISAEMIEQHLPVPGKNSFICHCGPGPMNQHVRALLLSRGYSDKRIFKF